MAKANVNSSLFVMYSILTTNSQGLSMFAIDPHYPAAGLIFAIGAIAFLKFFDMLAVQSARRLSEMAGKREEQAG